MIKINFKIGSKATNCIENETYARGKPLKLEEVTLLSP
jgi:hypothetical protein